MICFSKVLLRDDLKLSKELFKKTSVSFEIMSFLR